MANQWYQLPPGTIVGGRYHIEKVLGEGGYGITYYGTDLRLKLPVAVKEYYPGFWAARDCRESLDVKRSQAQEESYLRGLARFEDEALTLAQFHMVPEIVLVRDYLEENETGYLVMEYLDGQNLKQMTDGFGGRIPPEILMPLMESLILAVQKVHEKGLIHRDISPDNIMMLENGHVKLLDFGNARDVTEDRSMTLAMKQGFAPPEQYRSRGQGTWTDVYSLCATVYYCLTGKLPVQAMDRLTGKKLPTPGELGVRLPRCQEETILQGLDLFVDKRPQTMRELWEKMYAPEDDFEGVPGDDQSQMATQAGDARGRTTDQAGNVQSRTVTRAEDARGQSITQGQEMQSQIINQTGRIDVPAPDSDKTADGNSALPSSFEDLRNGGFREVCIAIFRKLRGLSGME